jgi:hypothetical protein
VHVRAGRERQVQIGELRGRGAARIEGHDLDSRTLLAGGFNALQDDRVAPGGVRAHQHH